MSEIPVMLASENVQKARLLTFDRLSLTDLDRLQPAVSELSSQAAVFENHYLRYPGFNAILGTQDATEFAGGDRIQAEIFVWPEASLFGDGFADEVQKQLPAGWKARALNDSASAASLDEWRGEVCDRSFVWMHTAAADSEQFESAVQLLQSICDDQSLLMVTALRGADPSENESMPFESLLPESQIRAPLWVQGTGMMGYRVQGITGSLDVMQTVRGVLSQHMFSESTAVSLATRSLNLLSLARWPGQQIRRHVVIQSGAFVAVRTDNFLYVTEQSKVDDASVESPTAARSALYAKPADVWNVHDVAGEYLDVVEEHSRYLDQHQNNS